MSYCVEGKSPTRLVPVWACTRTDAGGGGASLSINRAVTT